MTNWGYIGGVLALISLLTLSTVSGAVLLLGYYLRLRNETRRGFILDSLATDDAERLSIGRKTIAGFFHPYCNAGGGGERVLWAAVAYLQRTEPDLVCVVYTGDTEASKGDIISNVQAKFGIKLAPDSLVFAYLSSRHLVEGKTWARFTLFGQSLGSLVLVWEALDRVVPDIFLDTMGYSFIYPFLRALRLKPSPSTYVPSRSPHRLPIGAYVHYPTISPTMLQRVRNREAGITNQSNVASSSWRTTLKLIYYRLFAFAYVYSLNCADYIVVNGSWTKNHIDTLLHSRRSSQSRSRLSSPSSETEKDKVKDVASNGVDILYPPCDAEALQRLPLDGRDRGILLTVAQFRCSLLSGLIGDALTRKDRPEKNHSIQLWALHSLFSSHPEYRSGDTRVKLILIGTVRNADDAARVNALRALAKELDIQDNVEFVLNASYDELVFWLGKASIGISSMVDEHFGINVVDFIAAGLIPVVHASGGPLLDILTPVDSQPTGFFYATDARSVDFAASLHTALSLTSDEEHAMRTRARRAARRFSTAEFEWGFQKLWEGLYGSR
ncbi:glycosyltransferase family 4 protein [Hydnum rufescens UP504]|uniref:GDP-Man:Man(3)GlcNAc(2)-PP-Dol alpha-1,2-mannosyltransferase n=1 Tax=Hydnum rufescens UP504 TaxID=1448309 RepID=A0A9P6B277_9AGAM|nr:glycosyltransferase family 4 protein [Hydnum rufescens UP504]